MYRPPPESTSGQSHRHVQPHHVGLKVLVRLRVAVVQNFLGELLPGLRVELQQPQAAVEEHRAAGHAVHGPLLDEHAARDRPERLDLLVGHQPPILRGGTEPPRQLAVAGTQRIHIAVGRAEQGAPLMNRRRRIDAPAHDVAPHNTLPELASRQYTLCSSTAAKNSFPSAITGLVSLPPMAACQARFRFVGIAALVKLLRWPSWR